MKVEKKLLFNGAYYTGDVIDDIPNGFGLYESKTIEYEGYFKDGKFDGKGKLVDKEKKYTYIGEFSLGFKNGYGVITTNNGNYFEGMFYNNYINGVGLQRYSDGETYVGEFKNNIANGSGTVYYTNGNVYTGQFVNDKENGIGIIMEKGNREYAYKVEYNMGDGKMLGLISLTCDMNTNMVYRVIETDYKFYGMIDKYSTLLEGIYHFPKDSIFDVFIGSINDEFKKGIFFMKNGDKFDGFIENDELTGIGKYTIYGKGEYEGEFIKGLKVGEFKSRINGKLYIQDYDNGKLVSERVEEAQ